MPVDPDFSNAVLTASARPEVAEAVQELYRRLDEEIQRRQPICQLSGRCCHFDTYGHRLFVTTIEMADFLIRFRALVPARPREAGSALPPFDVERSTLDVQRSPPDLTRQGPILPILNPEPRTPLAVSAVEPNPDSCPFQVGKQCGVHSIRPFGCRIFFCDPTASEWQSIQYELFHSDLKRLHESLSVPYFYMEWRQALQSLNLMQTA